MANHPKETFRKFLFERNRLSSDELTSFAPLVDIFNHHLGYKIKNIPDLIKKVDAHLKKDLAIPVSIPHELLVEWIAEDHPFLDSLPRAKKKLLAKCLLSETVFLESLYLAIYADKKPPLSFVKSPARFRFFDLLEYFKLSSFFLCMAFFQKLSFKNIFPAWIFTLFLHLFLSSSAEQGERKLNEIKPNEAVILAQSISSKPKSSRSSKTAITSKTSKSTKKNQDWYLQKETSSQKKEGKWVVVQERWVFYREVGKTLSGISRLIGRNEGMMEIQQSYFLTQSKNSRKGSLFHLPPKKNKSYSWQYNQPIKDTSIKLYFEETAKTNMANKWNVFEKNETPILKNGQMKKEGDFFSAEFTLLLGSIQEKRTIRTTRLALNQLNLPESIESLFNRNFAEFEIKENYIRLTLPNTIYLRESHKLNPFGMKILEAISAIPVSDFWEIRITGSIPDKDVPLSGLFYQRAQEVYLHLRKNMPLSSNQLYSLASEVDLRPNVKIHFQRADALLVP